MLRNRLIALPLFAALLLFLPLVAGDQDFTLVNKTGVEIHSLFISSHNTQEWEEDVLGVDVLPDGDEVTISFDHDEDECSWDMMVTDDEGNSITWSEIDLCEYSTITLFYKNGKAWAECE